MCLTENTSIIMNKVRAGKMTKYYFCRAQFSVRFLLAENINNNNNIAV